MINQLNFEIAYSEAETLELERLLPHVSTMWDTPPSDTIKAIKASIRSQLLRNQNDICAYCGLDLGGTSEGQIEHIAPKAKYPQFTFERNNLAMACHHCNGFSKKGNHHTIETISDGSYRDCAFKLVHPYFDSPDDHYDWVSNERKVLIQSETDKGRYSIKMLKLDSPKMSELRGKKIIADIVLSNDETPQINDDLIQNVLTYKEYNINQ